METRDSREKKMKVLCILKDGSAVDNKSRKYKLYPCEICGKDRWVMHTQKGFSKHCYKCANKLRIKRELISNYVPSFGDIKCGIEIGNNRYDKYMWTKCLKCEIGHWSAMIHGKPRLRMCKKCMYIYANYKTVSKEINNVPPFIGEIRRDYEIGLKDYSDPYIWLPCPDCGKLRWVEVKKGKDSSKIRCGSCVRKGSNSNTWKGGRKIIKSGYIYVWLSDDDPYNCMLNKSGYVAEHRLIMASCLGRPLLREEIVHHINFIVDDNRVDNLQIMTNSEHRKLHHALRKRLLDGN